jgi:hypothetical protein
VILLDLLPERSAEDVLAGRIRVTLGTGKDQQKIDLPVLPIKPERAWKELLEKRLAELWDGLDVQPSPKSVMNYLGQMTSVQLEVLHAYDRSGVLPDNDWLEEHALSTQLLSALLGATAAAYPFVETAIDAVRSQPTLMLEMVKSMRIAFSKSTSGSPPSTAGRPKRSRKK